VTSTTRRTVVSLVIAGAVAGAVAGASLIALVEHGPDPSCSSGIEGLGCELAALAGKVLLALGLAVVADYAVLRALRVSRAGAVAVLSVLALAVWSMALDQLAGGVELRSLTPVLPMAVLNPLLHAVLERLPPKRWAAPAVAAAVIVAAWPLTGLGSAVESNRYQADQDRKIANADFETYAPMALAGYTAEPIRFVGPFGDDQPYVEWSARGPAGISGLRDSYTVRTFLVPATFAPPTRCGHAQPFDLEGGPCSEVSQTGRGEPVYVDGGATFSNVQTFFVRRGSTLITIETGVPDGLTAPQVVELVDRLRPTAR
jgi:hypothetical protein